MKLAAFFVFSLGVLVSGAAQAVPPIIRQPEPAPQAGCAAIKNFLSQSQLCWDLKAGETLLAVTSTYVLEREKITLPSGYDLKEILPAQAVLQQLKAPTALPQGASITVISQQVRPVESHDGPTTLRAVILLKITAPQEGGTLVGEPPELRLPVNFCAKRERSSGIGLVDLFGGTIKFCDGDNRQEVPLSAASAVVEQVSYTAPPAKKN
jgi:hypothetical protein